MATRIGITGHRKLADEADVRNALNISLRYFKERTAPGELIAVSSLAVGTDTIFAEEALKLQIPLEIIIPFALAEYKKDFTAGQKDTLKKLIGNNEFFIVHTKLPANKEERDEAYLATGKMITDICQAMIAVWDKKPAAGKGGTGDIVEYAGSIKKELHIINVSLIGSFRKTDKKIENYKKIFNLFWMFGIGSALLAAFCLAFTLSFEIKDEQLKFAFNCIEIILLLFSYPSLVIVASWLKKRQLRERRRTEFSRALQTYIDAEIPVRQEIEKNEFNDPGEENDLSEKNAVRDSKKLQDSNFENAKRTVYGLALGQSMYHSFSRVEKFRRLNRRYSIVLKLITALFLTAAAVHFFTELVEMKKIDYWTREQVHFLGEFTLFLSLFLPPLYASVEGIKYFNDWKANIKSSEEMISNLNVIAGKILKCNFADDEELVELAQELRVHLNKENIDWAEKINRSEIEVKPN